MRRQVGREYKRAVRRRNDGGPIADDDPRLFSPILHGKDEQGEPARSHAHAFYVPADEDSDGRIDHVTIFATGRFSRDDVAAIDRLRSLSFGEGPRAQAETGSHDRPTTHRLLLVGLDDLTRLHGDQFGPAWVWESATPYIAFRHLKRRGRKRDVPAFHSADAFPLFMSQFLREDWDQRTDLQHLPPPEKIEYIPAPHESYENGGLGWRHRSLQFRRGRSRRGDDGYTRPFGAFRLTFPVAIQGPLNLGYACHFGLGLFRAASSVR